MNIFDRMRLPPFSFIIKKAALISGTVLASLLVVLLIIGLIPVSTGELVSHQDTAVSYSDSAQRIQAVKDAESGQVCDICGTRFYTHGDRTQKAVVLIHGLTNSPRQFEEMGVKLYNDGYNVLIPRMPYHGLTTHTVSELGNLKTSDLQVFADSVADMAAGLGDQITVVGLSGGGTIAAEIVQNRSDIDRAVLIAPLFGLSGVPAPVNTFLGNLFSRIPNINVSSSSEPPRASVYLGWSSRGVAEYLLFSRVARPPDSDPAPAVRNIVLITNANDHTVNNDTSKLVVTEWESAGARVTRYEFEQSLGLPHDYIDITSIGDRSQWVYPIVIGLIEAD
ncbi:MAG: alpha/beta fold hydrolase [Actinobacteria bacterium]|nr:alpha/beta fold hydrolase [Actinomycetota bacterium]